LWVVLGRRRRRVVVDVVVVVVTAAAVTMLRIEALHVTKPPPPLPEPTHWWIWTGRAEVIVESPATEHRTRWVAPPPLPELLHWVTVASDVPAVAGLHAVVGWVPPPCPAVLHWLTVAAATVPEPVTLFVTFTEQRTVPPPPLPEPSHCVTSVVSAL
jgi:hypothetical protein